MVGLEHPTIRLRGGDVTTSSPLHVTIVILQSNRMDFIEIKNSMIITHIKRLVQRRICGGGGGGGEGFRTPLPLRESTPCRAKGSPLVLLRNPFLVADSSAPIYTLRGRARQKNAIFCENFPKSAQKRLF